MAIEVIPSLSAEPVTINFWHAMDGPRGKTLERLIQVFNTLNPDIKVIGTFKGVTDVNKDKYKNSYNILFQELLINISTQSPPDVSQVYENWTSQFITINAISPLDNFVNSSEGYSKEEISDFIPIFWEANKYDGKLWSLPFNKSIYVLYYNKESFVEQKLKPPSTWEELSEIAPKFVKRDKKGNISRYAITFKADVDIFSVILLSNGGDLLDMNKRAIFNGEDGQKTIHYLKKLIDSGTGQVSFEPQKEFVEDRCAMFLETSSKISALEGKTSFTYGVAPCPKTEGKILFAGTNLAIFSTISPEKQKASWKFIKWLTNTQNTAIWSMETGYLPVRTSAIQSKEYQDFLKKNTNHEIAIEQLDNAIIAPRVSSWQSIRGIIDDTVFNAVVTKEDVKESLNTAVSTANKFLQ